MSLRLTGRAVAVLAMTMAGWSTLAKERSEIPDRYKWNLADLYPSVQAWADARTSLQKRVPEMARFRGHLGDSAESLRKALDAMFGLQRDLERLSVYAQSLSDEDTRASKPREMKQAADQLAVELDTASSFVRPEILSLDAAKVRSYLAEDRGLAPYRFFVEDTLRWKPHTLPAPEERIVAEAGALTDAGSNAYGVLKDADLPYPVVQLTTGEKVRMDSSAFTLHRASPVRQDRDASFAAFLGAMHEYRGTFGTTLYATVRSHLFTKNVRGFDSALAAALFRGNIPTTVYTQLLADVHRTLPTFWRYLALRKRMLGLDVLRYQDLYVPIVPKMDMTFAPDEARAITLDAVKPLGPEYVATLRKGFESRWTDYLPNTGKRSGAYSTGVYGVHPYQLLNFNGKYDDLSTLAHESGHSIHTWLSYEHQPYPTAEYPIFVAEVASTLNENLLLHEMLGRAKDDPTRLFLLGSYLDHLKGSLFRQAQFAEFELAMHQMAQRGETLTGDNLSALYLKITREYYGHDRGVCVVDDSIASEWAMIPHFYYNFYVYQYATSTVASTAIAKAIRDGEAHGDTKARDAYLRMLSAGGSKYPIELLREAGVDMTTSAPFDATIAEMNGIMDEVDRILARQGSAHPAK